jgi:hypothetical protein
MGSATRMEYVIAGLLVLIVVSMGVTMLVLSARRLARRRQSASSDSEFGAGAPGTDTAILAPDSESPLGDTSEHAGEQRDGETVAGTARIGDRTRRRADDDAQIARPVVGGEGEGTRRIPRRG